jgi:hypothetical protein
MRYENSVLWSRRFTPWHFKYFAVLPAAFVFVLLVYLRYIGTPRRIIELKKRLGVKFR